MESRISGSAIGLAVVFAAGVVAWTDFGHGLLTLLTNGVGKKNPLFQPKSCFFRVACEDFVSFFSGTCTARATRI